VRLRLAALVLGVVAGFVFGWARLTDPNTYGRRFTCRSPYVYLLMASAVAIAFVGARALRGRPALLDGARIDWQQTRPTRDHIVGSVVFGIGWGLTEACPRPDGSPARGGRIFALAVAAGVVLGVKLQPRLAQLGELRQHASPTHTSAIPATEVL
jgi:uncharacterized membrane protein YedE/YeeE